jgi:hypothetical protein
MGKTDRVIRIIIVIIIGISYYYGKLPAPWATILALGGLFLIATVALSRCPLYKLLGLSTCECDEGVKADDNEKTPVTPV